MKGLIDYAGLFPPAVLPPDQALREYSQHRDQSESWMLARFIAPARKLQTLGYRPYHQSERSSSFSVLVGGGNDAEEFLGSLKEDLAAVALFLEEFSFEPRTDVFEVKLPLACVSDEKALFELLQAANDLFRGFAESSLAGKGWDLLTPYYEIAGLTPVSDEESWKERVLVLVSQLKILSDRYREVTQSPLIAASGFKLRCGGVTPTDFPSPAQVAFAVENSVNFAVPFKATAGLHEAIRYEDKSLAVMRHGFLNVFGAAVLCHARGLDEARVLEIIEERDGAQFSFSDETFSWRDISATTAEITSARELVARSYGSCSFEEPKDALRKLGWL